jgi:N-acetylglucosaminyldiphosphoundecaprenol N-acetyl-beta-D-mannosaminyltransferase
MDVIMEKIPVLGVPIDITSYKASTKNIIQWAKDHQSRYICAANVHMVMEAYDHKEFKEILRTSDMVTPDGMPLVWILRIKGEKNQERVYGPTLMLHILEAAAKNRIPVGLYGGNIDVLDKLVKQMKGKYSELNIAYFYSPPFRALSLEEDDEICRQIHDADVRLLFVGLGCPKQEIWMGGHWGRIKAVMVGVGAAFDFHAGIKLQAPIWMQTTGLEWLFRLLHEPRRLARRYLYNNPRFVLLALMDLLGILNLDK